MTGAQHYPESEGYAHLADTEPEGSTLTPVYTALGQLHATLAPAAATVLPIAPLSQQSDWLAVLATMDRTP